MTSIIRDSRWIGLVARCFMAFVIAVMHVHAAYAQEAVEAAPRLKRGVGYHGPMTWGLASPDRTTYRWPPYDATKYRVDTELLRKVKAAGFDHVRLTVDPGPFLAANAEQRADLDASLVTKVTLILQTGLDVLVDLHPISMVPRFDCPRLLEEATFPTYVDLARSLAGVLTRFDATRIAFEPFNEPCLAPNAAGDQRWGGMMRRLHDAVRQAAPKIKVVVAGNRWGQHVGMIALDPKPYAGSNVVFTFHYYNPFEFTHQGFPLDAHSPQARSLTKEIPYPARPDQLQAFMAQFERRVSQSAIPAEGKARLLESGRRQLAAYFSGAASPAGIAREFDQIAEWARANKVEPSRIYMGEFGVVAKVPEACVDASPSSADRLAWLRDVRTRAETSGFGWSYWALNANCSGMQLVRERSGELDDLTLNALGMR